MLEQKRLARGLCWGRNKRAHLEPKHHLKGTPVHVRVSGLDNGHSLVE
jgi:hypothetical protein